MEPFPQFYIPDVYDNLSTKNVLTTKLVTGKPVDKIADADQDLRNEVFFFFYLILKLLYFL